jgi:hypothetical protein
MGVFNYVNETIDSLGSSFYLGMSVVTFIMLGMLLTWLTNTESDTKYVLIPYIALFLPMIFFVTKYATYGVLPKQGAYYY